MGLQACLAQLGQSIDENHMAMLRVFCLKSMAIGHTSQASLATLGKCGKVYMLHHGRLQAGLSSQALRPALVQQGLLA